MFFFSLYCITCNSNESLLIAVCTCFLQYASIFNRGGMHPIPSTVEAATVMSSTTSFDDSSLSDVYHSPPRPLPYDADPRYFRFAKGSSHSGEEAEPLRGDTEMSSEVSGGGAKRNKSGYEDGSKEAYSKGSPTDEKSKLQLSYADSDDEDICPTCLDGTLVVSLNSLYMFLLILYYLMRKSIKRCILRIAFCSNNEVETVSILSRGHIRTYCNL